MRSWLKALLLAALLFAWATPSIPSQPVVRAVLFYSPTCPHCHKVMTESLPPILKKYGAQLRIAGVDVRGQGQVLYRRAIARFHIPEDRQGVPTLIVGTVVLVGEEEIPDRLPGLVEAGLKAGGIDWPDIEGLKNALPEGQDANAPGAGGPLEKLARDPVGNGLALLVLLGMIATVGRVAYRRAFVAPVGAGATALTALAWPVPVLALAGILISAYMLYVEVMPVQAFCGPVGDCETVQQSEYARLFGVPMGLVGISGYLAILAAWVLRRYGGQVSARWGGRGLLLLTTLGVLFSIYLTFLEPLVIGASCMWCLTSAVLMTALFWLSVGKASTLQGGPPAG
jgi:uncharacterized membrane protein/thiol-disulfide isomerase/thioredoxin